MYICSAKLIIVSNYESECYTTLRFINKYLFMQTNYQVFIVHNIVRISNRGKTYINK